MNVSKNYCFFSLALLLVLAGCRQPKMQRVEEEGSCSKQECVEEAMPRTTENATKVSFFDDQEVGDFDEVESFALDDENAQPKDTTVALEENTSDVALAQESDDHGAKIVYFEYDSAKPRADQKAIFEEVKKTAQEWQQEGKTVVFKGHSCLWHGTRAYNLALSSERAQNLADACDLNKNNVRVFGVGNEEPVVLSDNKEAQAPNRRVEIYAITA